MNVFDLLIKHLNNVSIENLTKLERRVFMVSVKNIIELLDCIVPFDCVAKKDNSGLLVGSNSYEVTKVLFAVDLTELVIDEAIEKGCQMIVTHHHMMGKGIKTVTPSTYEGRAIGTLLEHKIAFVACHNNLDFLTDGTAHTLMTSIGILETRPLYEGFAFLATTPQEINATSITVPKRPGIRNDLRAGFGMVGDLDSYCTLIDIIHRLEGIVTGPVNVVGSDEHLIKRVSCQVGAGEQSDIDRSKELGVDLFISGDVRHDNRLYAKRVGMCLLDFCHYEVELPGILALASKLKEEIKKSNINVEILISDSPQPVRHLTMATPLDLSKFRL